MIALYVDDVPILFSDAPDPRTRAFFEPLGDRVREGEWTGAYPLTGDALAESLAKLAAVEHLIPEEVRR